MKGAIQLKDNNNRNRRGCGCIRMARGRWDSFPYYGGPCPNTDGCYHYNDNCDNDDDREERCRCRRRRRRRCDDPCGAIFQCNLPIAVSANGIIPLVVNNPCRDSSFEVNSGLVTLEKGGTYLATYTVRVPETAALDTTITLNVDDASQSSAVTQVMTEGGASTTAYTAQAIFEADEGTTVSMRTSDAISVTSPSAQPMFTLSLVQLDE